MARAVVKLSKVKPPAGLVQLFGDPPLVGSEKREDYDNFFSTVAAAVNPADAIAWLFTRDISDLSWEIRRERKHKLQVIRSAEIDTVKGLLMPPRSLTDQPIIGFESDPISEKAANEAEQWACDPKARREINKELMEKGYDASRILEGALNRAAEHIDAIDRRIASYELRRMAALRAAEHHSEMLARRLDAASNVVEGQFTEAAE
jgi:hypothetical protein